MTKNKFKNISAYRKASIFGVTEAVFYALIPLVFLLSFYENPSFPQTLISALVLTMAKDFLPFIYLTFILFINPKYRHELLQTFKTKKALLAGIAGIFGGAIGYSFFNIAFYLAGPSYGQIFSSLQPVLIAIYAFFIWKRKYLWNIWLGIGITVAGSLLLIIGIPFSSKDNSTNVIIGSIFAISAVITWTVEALIMDRLMTIHVHDSPMVLLWFKIFFSLIFGFLLFPVFSSLDNNPAKAFELFGSIFTNSNFLIRWLLAGTFLFLGRILFFETMKLKGSAFSTIVFQTSIVMTPIFDLIYFGITGDYIGSSYELTLKYQLTFWFATFIIVIGVLITVKYSRNIEKL